MSSNKKGVQKSKTSLDTLYSSNCISKRLYYILTSMDIDDLIELQGFEMSYFYKVRGVGPVLLKELCNIADELGISIIDDNRIIKQNKTSIKNK